MKPTTLPITLVSALLLTACQGTHATHAQKAGLLDGSDQSLIVPHRQDLPALAWRADNLLGSWRLIDISDKDGTPIHAPLWQNTAKPYAISFHGGMLGRYSLSMPNDCNQISVPFAITQTGIRPDFQQVMTTHAKCDTVLDDSKIAHESSIHDAIYYGEYQLFGQGDERLLIIDRHGNELIFMMIKE